MQRIMLVRLNAVILGVLAAAACVGAWRCLQDSVTTQLLSPDEAYRVVLVERGANLPLKIDRNFDVRLQRIDKGETLTIFSSPDEGRPAGSERFYWSKDSTYVLLAGRHFFVERELPVGGGTHAYFLYHIPSGQSWCNAKGLGSHLNPLTVEVLRGIDFGRQIELSNARQ